MARKTKSPRPEAKLVTGYLDIFISPDGKEPAVRLAVRGEVACWCELDREQAFRVAHQILEKAIDLQGAKRALIIENESPYSRPVLKLPVDV